MSAPEALVFTIRPGGHSLWLPATLAARFGLKRGDHVTEAQMASVEIEELLAEYRQREEQRGKGKAKEAA